MIRLAERTWPEVAQLARAAARLHEAPIYIDDTPAISVLEMRAKCRRLKAEHNIGLIVVDYLQLMTTGASVENRVQEVSQIFRRQSVGSDPTRDNLVCLAGSPPEGLTEVTPYEHQGDHLLRRMNGLATLEGVGAGWAWARELHSVLEIFDHVRQHADYAVG